MKLELTTRNLRVEFECQDEGGDHLNVLTLLQGLISELEHHDNVYLTVVSSDASTSERDTDPAPEYEDADPQ